MTDHRTTDPKPSRILAMHQRYEEAMAEYDVVDRAAYRARGAQDCDFKLDTALKALTRETDALRVAILHSVPDTWQDALVLQFHITTAFDMQAGIADTPIAVEEEALHTAIGTLFDFMCCEVKADHEQIGGAFQSEAARAFYQRRYRTGNVED